MTDDQKLLKRKREERETLGAQVRALMSKSELGEAEQAERDSLMTRSLSLDGEIEYLKKTVKAQGDSIETREIETDNQADEWAGLFKRSSVADFMNEPFGYTVEGASREYRDELGISPGYVPIDFLLGENLEKRSDVVTSISASDAPEDKQVTPILLPVMAGSSAEYLGIRRPVAGVGSRSYVTVTSTPTADYRSDRVRKDAEAIGIVVKTVDPVRITSRVSYSIETPARVPGFESVITPILRSAVNDKLDAVAIAGQSPVNNVSPKIIGLIQDLTAVTDPSDAATWSDFLTVYNARVDGKLSMNGDNVRVLVNPDVWRFASNLMIDSLSQLLSDRLPEGRFRSSANVPAAGSNNIGTGVSYTAGHNGFYQPTWRAAQIIRDNLSNAAEGQENVTIIMLSNNVLVDKAPYKLHKFKIV